MPLRHACQRPARGEARRSGLREDQDEYRHQSPQSSLRRGRLNKVLFGILVFIDLAIGALAAHYLLTGIPEFSVGVFLIGVSLLSFYGAAAVLLNTMAGKTILPMGKAFWTPRK